MKKYIIILCITIFSCVSQDKYDKSIQEKEALQKQLEDLKFGAPNLLSDAKKFLDNKDYLHGKEKLKTLIERHPDRPESAEAKKILDVIDEQELWNNALNSNDITNTQNYISQYPSGKYIQLAKKRLDELKIHKEKIDYEYALSQNSSTIWKDFLSNYPNRNDLAQIKKRIIQCEVDEIMGDKETGQLPSSNQTNFDYSSSSDVSISNDTQCELTIRYSGPDVKMVVIPAGGTRTAYLTSGSYRIAASACGYNYGGTEDLHGNYTSRYYIVRSQ